MLQQKPNRAALLTVGVILVIMAAGAIVYGLQNLKINALQSRTSRTS